MRRYEKRRRRSNERGGTKVAGTTGHTVRAIMGVRTRRIAASGGEEDGTKMMTTLIGRTGPGVTMISSCEMRMKMTHTNTDAGARVRSEIGGEVMTENGTETATDGGMMD